MYLSHNCSSTLNTRFMIVRANYLWCMEGFILLFLFKLGRSSQHKDIMHHMAHAWMNIDVYQYLDAHILGMFHVAYFRQPSHTALEN